MLAADATSWAYQGQGMAEAIDASVTTPPKRREFLFAPVIRTTSFAVHAERPLDVGPVRHSIGARLAAFKSNREETDENPI